MDRSTTAPMRSCHFTQRGISQQERGDMMIVCGCMGWFQRTAIASSNMTEVRTSVEPSEL
jgi:hypothetical protein